MSNKSYWAKRFMQLEEAQINKGADYCAELEKQYKKAEKEIEKQIAVWYARFASNNEISMSDAKKLLISNELTELKWDIEEYIKVGRENNVDGRWIKELENASAKVHINRLESLTLQIQQQIETLYAGENDSFTETMKDIYEDSYYHTAFELQRGTGKGFVLMQLDQNKIDKVLLKPWTPDGSNFSSRIWKHRSQLVAELTNHLSQILIRGITPDEAIKDIQKRFQASTNQAKTLVMTELAFVHSAAKKEMFEEFDVERYQIIATLDKKTSEICRRLDHKVIDMKDYRVGATAPPFHTRCRTTTIPFYEDEFTDNETRAARDPKTGKTYYVPANMSYKEWYEKYVRQG